LRFKSTTIKLVVIFNSLTMDHTKIDTKIDTKINTNILNISGKFRHSTYKKIRTIQQQGSLFKVIYEEGGNFGFGEIFRDNNQWRVLFWNTCGSYLHAKIMNNGNTIDFEKDVWTR